MYSELDLVLLTYMQREWLEIVDATKRKHLSEKEKKKEHIGATSPNPASPSRSNNRNCLTTF